VAITTGRTGPWTLATACSISADSLRAGGSVLDESAAAQWFQAASPATVCLWVVPNAEQTAALATQPRAWDEQVASFLDAALNPATVAAIPAVTGPSAAKAGRPALPCTAQGSQSQS
jgi:hypothetical protein